MVFEQNNHRLTSSKYHIWNQHTKLSRSMYVWHCFGDFCFRRHFYLWSHTEICEKMNLIRTNILAVIHGFLSSQTTFHNFRTFFPISKSLFHSSYIFTYSWGGPQVKIWQKKSQRNNFKQTWVDSGFCPDSKYGSCLKWNRDHSVRKSPNISEKWLKLDLISSIRAKVIY